MERRADAPIPTQWGLFNMIAFSDDEGDWMPHLVMMHEDFDASGPVYVRIHSECITGDLFASKRCDCGPQLERSLEIVGAQKGLLIYLRQEGRGIGIINKLRAYNLQDEGLNTAEANTHLGLEIDPRRYDVATGIMKTLGVKEVHLLTNNPLKIQAVQEAGIKVVSRVPVIVTPGKENYAYLKTKQDLMGHLLKK